MLLAEDSKLLATDYDQVTADVRRPWQELPGPSGLHPAAGPVQIPAPIKLDEKTRYIGVIARYADPDSAEWRKVIKIKSKGTAYQILVHLRLDEVELQKKKNNHVESKSGYLA